MGYVNKATITLSVQKYVPIEGIKEKNMVCLPSICFGI